MAGLIVKLDWIAEMRATRNESHPDPIAAAVLADLAGADGIAMHPREGLHPMLMQDVRILRQAVQKTFILEIWPTPEMVNFSLELKPDLVTLVPDAPEASVIKAGMDLVVHRNEVSEAVETLHGNNIPVCILLDPVPEQIKLAHQADADRIELFTTPFCAALKTDKVKSSRSDIIDAAKFSRKLKMAVDAGGGLDYNNIREFRGVRQIETFTIGYSIISRAILTGMEAATKEMVAQISAL
ncbi:MAG: pyridoxine 5'-phosphate synthase [Desulfobacterales bacterium]